MSYNYLSKNNKLLTDLYKRKNFKNYIFHNSNNDEGYEWDDYDTTHFYPEIENNPIHIIVNSNRKIYISKDYIKYFFQEGDVYKHIIIVNY